MTKVVLEYFHIKVGLAHFWFKILNSNIFGNFQNEFFFLGGGLEDFVDIFWIIVKLDYFEGSFLCIFFSSEYLWQVYMFESRLNLRH